MSFVADSFASVLTGKSFSLNLLLLPLLSNSIFVQLYSILRAVTTLSPDAFFHQLTLLLRLKSLPLFSPLKQTMRLTEASIWFENWLVVGRKRSTGGGM